MPKKNEYTISLKQDGPPAKETSQSIAEQVDAFIQSGGKINEIPSGVSGQVSLGEKARLAREEKMKQDQADYDSEDDSETDSEIEEDGLA